MRKREFSKKLFSILFLFIFFAKMVITLAPLMVKHFDRETMNAVIMQLEIENNAKGSDMSKELFKDFTYTSFNGSIAKVLQSLTAIPAADNDASHRCSFYPTVLTPPPNV